MATPGASHRGGPGYPANAGPNEQAVLMEPRQSGRLWRRFDGLAYMF
jgi:hypothetical protein